MPDYDCSPVDLGVHYISDIVAGLCITVTTLLRIRLSADLESE